MDKEDTKVLIHAGLALVVIFGGFALIEMYGKPMITGGAIGPQGPKETSCVQVIDKEHTGIMDRSSCCRLIQGTDKCELLDGTIDIGYDYQRTGEPSGSLKAEYVCLTGTTKLYFGFDTYEYCELEGHRIILS